MRPLLGNPEIVILDVRKAANWKLARGKTRGALVPLIIDSAQSAGNRVVYYEFIKRIKKMLDPEGIMNPGVLIPS